MMSKKYLIPLLIISNTSFASESLNQLIKKLESSDEIRCEEMTHDELAEHCVREVCGPPGNRTSRLTAKNLDKFLTAEQQKELKNLEAEVTDIFKRKKQELEQLVSELEKRSKDPNFKNTNNWDKYQYQDFANLFWKYIKWDIDASKPKNERSQVSVIESAPPALVPGIKEFAENFRKTTYDDPLYAYEAGIYNEEELKEVILEKAKKLQTELSSIKKTDSFDLQKFSKELSNLSDTEEISSHLQKIEDLASDNGIVITSNELYCQDQCQKAINQFVKNTDFNTEIENLKVGIKYLDEKDKLAECKANFVIVNQQNNHTQNFEKMWPEVKAAYHKNVLPRFSEHSRKMMSDYLDNGIHFYFENPTYETFPDLKEMKEKLTKNQSPVDKKRNALLITDLYSRLDPDINIITADIEICNTSAYHSSIWDSYLAKENILPMYSKPYYVAGKDNISVSPYTCEHHREGSGILAHELGHAMSKLMTRDGMSESSLKEYQTIRRCASSQWDISTPAERPYHPDDKQFTEEDAADIISYMAINDGKTVTACGFMDVDPSESSYADFSTDPWGSHSPALVRLLREVSYKKKEIPKTCGALMARNQDKMGDEKCF